ncbi:hypothetical protein Ddye_022718 [Dipteronia dyeriana]|uniref:HAT C-terminal dimerisation domain-containing protein n=1 Tax=Dipteronia dyeriana TaxID=168575 RepID=A0AAD9TRL6_9ROSI|nr:hypothetical protein Ddye_022718 [Dipteronia dyeriana]
MQSQKKPKLTAENDVALVTKNALKLKISIDEVSDQIDRIRDAISWIYNSNPRFSEFKRHCKLNGLKPRRFQTDMLVRWNSTYLMLENCLEYDTTITCFYNMKLAETGRPEVKTLTKDDWYVAKVFVQFLKIFYNVTVTLSEVYYLTSSQVIHQIVEMSEVLNSYREDEYLGTVVVAMETKLKKYWANIPLLYASSVIVDPRFDTVEEKEEFDLLLWWKTYTYRYLVLSNLACDVLVIPVSTVSSEQAFSTSGRIIEPRISCLSPEMVEVLTCLRD